MPLIRFARGIGMLMFAGVLPAHAQTNSCIDPYWATTLRCQLAPLATPQPPPAPPANVAQIKPYTRVNLPFDPNLRCLDGTRPIFYVDKAVGAPSNKWLITMGGGDFCSARDLDGNGSYESGDRCLDYYVDELGLFMGTANAEAMSSLNDENGNGIHKPDPRVNPVFAAYNRVRVHKCGYDRHSGRATHLGVSGSHPLTGPVTFDLYNHGQKIVLAIIDALEGPAQAGLTYPTWVASGGNVSVVQESLPSIADAEQVVFIGHSAAAQGLYQNIDRYAAYLRAQPGFNGDVRVIHDAQFMHAAENEAAFDPARNPDPLSINTLFNQHYDGNSSLFGLYNAMPYFTTTFVADDYPAWLETPLSPLSTLVDQSCIASHQAADAWKCTDRLHVRLHHETTPALIREDYLDPGTEHNNEPLGHVVQWGPLTSRPECAEIGFTPCPPVLTLQQNLARLNMQARHFLEGVHTRSELATGADASGTPGSVFLWMPSCHWHSGAYSDSQFFRVGILQDNSFLTYRQFAELFVQAPATGVIASRVSGLAGAISDCGTMLADGFEPGS